jgi:uncharacterized protein YuzE
MIGQFKLEISEDDADVAYLYLPSHPGKGTPGVVSKQICLSDEVEGYKGPEIYLDFDENGMLIGMEMLA